MSGKPPKKAEIDPQKELLRKFRAKCRFRRLCRLVAANLYWLVEDVEQYEGIEDVKRRVQQAVRGKTKKKQLLSITNVPSLLQQRTQRAGRPRRSERNAEFYSLRDRERLNAAMSEVANMKNVIESDKALLNKPADERTELEKKYIYRIIGGLKCFKRYPNHVKKRLAAVTYYKYYGPGRDIVRQHHEAHALYFIAAGDVSVSQRVLDELLDKYEEVEIGQMHAGDMFGEVSLLHNIPRTATCTTIGHCELLALMKEDFKTILQASVQRQWDEVSHAMSAFTYFDSLDEVARREGCIVAKMKSFEPNDIILGDGHGVPNFVYFTLSGRCQMIETLQVIVTKIIQKEHYTLYDPYVPEEEGEQDLDAKYFTAYKNKEQTPTVVIQSSSIQSEQSEITKQRSSVSSLKSAKLESILKPPSSIKRSGSKVSEKLMKTEEIDKKSQTSALAKTSEVANILLPPSDQQQGPRDSVRLSDLPEFAPDSLKQPSTAKPPNIRTYFLQVCQFFPGSTFGFGENMRDRRIIAMNRVDCLLLPMVWLLQRNTANIWTRIQHFLEKKIPSKKELFKEFVRDRRWQDYRERIVEDIVGRSKTVNFTTIHDVPYSIRMAELHSV